MKARAFHPSIIREYDIRGISDETLSAEDAHCIGRCFATMASREVQTASPRIVTARDGRLSSPLLHEALCDGLIEAGAQVLHVGVGPTPLCYFAAYHFNSDAAVMLTGSHNPPTHNGMKFMLQYAPFYGAQIRELAQMAAQEAWQRVSGGTLTHHDIREAYVDAMLKATNLSSLKAPFPLVFDAGNGATGEICVQLAEKLSAAFPSEVLFAQIDGHFPNHHPDPSVPENLSDLIARVTQTGAKLGLAFDGDGDRLGAVDDKGRIISSDHLLMLLARGVLRDRAGATIIADVKTSQMVFDDIAALGGTPLMWMTGHSHIKKKLKETGAAFAGEASGHLFFADRYYGFDDGLYAALRLIELAASLSEPLSTLIDSLPRFFATPELRIDVSEERKFTVIDEIRARLDAQNASYLAIDGVRMRTDDGWWLIRASNTQAAIIARAESSTSKGLRRLTETLIHELSASCVQSDVLQRFLSENELRAAV